MARINSKVLVVDNHPVVLKFMKDMLEKEKYQVVTAEDGLSVLNILKNYVPEVIFVDLVMPNIDGKKLCRIINKTPELQDAFIIILTATAAEEEIDIDEIGAHACIAKGPFNKMAENILGLLNKLKTGSSTDIPKKVIGLQDIFPREITRELLSIKRHFEVVLESMSEGIIEVNPDLNIVFANKAAISLTGLPEEKLLGSSFLELIDSIDRRRTKKILNQVSPNPNANVKEGPLRLNDRRVMIQALPISDKDNTILLNLSDITDQMRIEALLHQAQKMEAIGTLAAGIAHDFNNLLMGVQGNTSLMLLNTDPDHPNYENLKSIENQVRSGCGLTGQLLGYARKGKYEVKQISLNQLIEETSETFGRARKNINIYYELAEKLYAIEADQGQVEQVLLNLFINAADAMPNGGDLFIKSAIVTDGKMTGKLYRPKPGNYVQMSVRDTGIGIDENTKSRIFDPFFTTKEMGRGIGLGLASVYGIIKGHGGYIDVISEKGKGTEFLIYFPASKSFAKVKSEPSSKPSVMEKGTETVLLVDDEDIVLEIGTELLKRLCYKVFLARDGREAVQIYEKHRKDIHLVLLDMVMPNMSGGETFNRLKEINPEVKVLLSSGYSIEGEASDILERGCDGFVQKPFSIEEMSQAIRQILDQPQF